MTNVDVSDMLLTTEGFEIFCKTPKDKLQYMHHLVAGKKIQLGYLCIDDNWFDENEDLDDWVGMEDEYDGCQPIYWCEEREAWIHDFSEEVWTNEEYELWKEDVMYNAQDFFAVISEEDMDLHEYAVKCGIDSNEYPKDCWGIETNEYKVSSEGSKPPIHWKGRVPAFNTSGEYICHLWIEPSVRNEAAGGPVVE